MPKSSIEDQIQARIEAFATELSALVRHAAIEAVEDALVGAQTRAASPTQKKRKPGRPKGSKTVARKATKKGKGKGKRIRRTAADLKELSGTILTYVRTNSGQGLEEISSGMGVTSAELKKPIKDMLASKKLRKKGDKRGTKYFAK